MARYEAPDTQLQRALGDYNPFTEVQNRLSTFVPGYQSKVFPDAPGILVAGDPGVSSGIASNYYKAFMPRIGVAFDPTGRGVWSIRAGYGIFYDPFSNGANLATQAPVSSVPWGQFFQITGTNVPFVNPYGGNPLPPKNTFLTPTTAVVLDNAARPPYAQDWNFSIQHSFRNGLTAGTTLHRHERYSSPAQCGCQSRCVWSGSNGVQCRPEENLC